MMNSRVLVRIQHLNVPSKEATETARKIVLRTVQVQTLVHNPVAMVQERTRS